jgi:DNA-directed RNA polymerase subunit RPC12/RpoP
MPIFRCGQCEQELSVGDEFVGYQIQCPSCQGLMLVPPGTAVPVAIVPPTREPALFGAIYTLLIATGVTLASYIYLIK